MQDYYLNPLRSIAPSDGSTTVYLHPEQITVPYQKKSGKKSLNSIIRLTESIKKYGILEPLSIKIAVCATGEPVYELISGAQRLKAAISAGITKIPCILTTNDNRNAAISGVLSSIQREGLHIFEQAAAFRLLIEDFGLTQEEISQRVGISQSAVANKLRLLRLSKEEQRQILSANLSERHARALLRLKEQEIRAEALRRVIAERMTVSATEQLVEEMLRSVPEQSKPVVSVVLTPETPPKGILPRKFALPDLTPLYNSIERTLSIFRKTGATAICKREEGAQGVRIIIEIPKA